MYDRAAACWWTAAYRSRPVIAPVRSAVVASSLDRTIGVRLVVTGADTFKAEVLGGAQAIDKLGQSNTVAQREIATTGKSMSTIGEVTRSALGSFLGFGAVTALTAIAGQGVNYLKKEVIGLDDELHQASAIMAHVTGGDMKDMENAARELSLRFGISATTIAQAFYFLASAGMNVQQSIAALPQVVAFSKAGMFDLETATSLAVDAQTALGLRSTDTATNLQNLARVTDVLTDAANVSNGSIEQFSESLTNKAAASGKAFGQDVEQIVSVLAGFADTGLKGRRAGEAYTIMLRELTSQAGKLNSVLDIKVFDKAGNLNAIPDILQQIEQRFSTMTVAQKVATLAQLGFSDEGRKMVLQLLGESSAIRKYEDDLRHAGGTTQEVAEKQMQSIRSRIGQFTAWLTEMARRGIDGLAAFAQFIEDEFGPAFDHLVSIGETAGDFLAPMLKGLLGIGAAGVKAGIEGVADILNVLLGFLDRNHTLVQILAALFVTKLAFGALEAAQAMGVLARAQLADWAYNAANALLGLVMNLQAAEGAGAKFSVLWQTFGGAIAFGAVAAAVAGIGGALLSANADADKLVESLTVKPTGPKDTIDALTKSAQQYGDQLDSIYAKTHRGGLGKFATDVASTVGDIALNIVGQGDVIHSPLDDIFDDQKLRKAKKGAEDMAAAIRGGFTTIRNDLVKQTGANDFDQLPFSQRTVQTQTKIAAQLTGIAKLTDRQLAAIADAKHIDLTGDVDTWLPKLRTAAQAFAGLTPAAQATALAFDDVNKAADVGTEKVDAYKNALDALFNETFGLDIAQDNLQKSINGVGKATDDYVKNGGNLKTVMTDTSDGAITLRDALRDVNAKLDDKVVADAKNGVSAKKTAADIFAQAVAFQQVASAAGLPKDAIEKVLAAMIKVANHPIVKAKVDAKPADDAAGKVKKVGDKLADLNKAKAAPTVSITDHASATIDRLLQKIQQLGNTTVTPTVKVPEVGSVYIPYPPGVGGGGPHGTTSGNPSDVEGAFANGGVLRFADGGHYTQQSSQPIAQIAPAGAMRVWAEPETGGEAYIPLADSKRPRSLKILQHVADLFGMEVVPHMAKLVRRFANGGMYAAPAEDDGFTADPPIAALSPEQIQLIANAQLRYLQRLMGIGTRSYVQVVDSNVMRQEYKGSTIYGSNAGAGNVMANGDPNSGRIQINADYYSKGIPVGLISSLYTAVQKEFSQTVLPHFLSTDAKIKQYLDIIGYHYKSDAHLSDDLNVGQAPIGTSGSTYQTTPADLFGYFAAHDMSTYTGEGTTYPQYAQSVVDQLAAAGLIPGPIPSPGQEVVEFFAKLSKHPPSSAVESAFEFLDGVVKSAAKKKKEAHDARDARSGVVGDTITRDGVTKQVLGGGRYRYADGGFGPSNEHVAQISPAGSMRMWAEPETGGEAYIPLSPAKRGRSLGLVEHVAALFGYGLTPKSIRALVDGGLVDGHGVMHFANGGVYQEDPARHDVTTINRTLKEFFDTLTSIGKAAREANVAIRSTQTYEADVARRAATFGSTASGAAATAQARGDSPIDTSSVQAFTSSLQQQNAAVSQSIDGLVRTYEDVSAAAGKAAADQLAASGLVGQAYDTAAQKIIARAEAAKEQAAEEKQVRRQLQDDEYSQGKMSAKRYLQLLEDRISHEKKYSQEWLQIHEQIVSVQSDQKQQAQSVTDFRRQQQDEEYQNGKISLAQYLDLLQRRLAHTKKYSQEWLTIMGQIQQVQADKVSKVQTQFDSFQQPTQSQTDVVSTLAQTAGITGAGITAFLDQAIAATKEFQGVTQLLLRKGFDPGMVEELMREGPKALPFAQALLTLPVGQVNSQLQQIGILNGAAGTIGVQSFGPADHSTTINVGGVSVEIKGGTGGADLASAAQIRNQVVAGVNEAFQQLEREMGMGVTAPAGG